MEKEDFTRDNRILPTVDRIRELLNQDRAKIVVEIQQKIMHGFEEKRGSVTVTHEIPDKHYSTVCDIISEWVKIFGYDAECTSKYRCDDEGTHFITVISISVPDSPDSQNTSRQAKSIWKHWRIYAFRLVVAITFVMGVCGLIWQGCK